MSSLFHSYYTLEPNSLWSRNFQRCQPSSSLYLLKYLICTVDSMYQEQNTPGPCIMQFLGLGKIRIKWISHYIYEYSLNANSTNAYYSLSAKICTRWIIGCTKWIFEYFSYLTPVEYPTKWIRIKWGPGVSCLQKKFRINFVLFRNFMNSNLALANQVHFLSTSCPLPPCK